MLSNLFKHHPLFKECVESLKATIVSQVESDELEAWFDEMIPMTKWGKIDWQRIDNKINLSDDIEQLIPTLQQLLDGQFDRTIFILWSTYALPIIKTNLNAVLQHYDDVTCVAFEKFIFNIEQGYIIEIKADGEITVGLINH